MANRETQTKAAVYFAESRMAAFLAKDVLLVDISGGVQGVVAGVERAIEELQTDLLVGLDVGGDSLARGTEPGLRSPLADSVMLAAFVELEKRGYRVLWGVFGYGSDGELSTDEIEAALTTLSRHVPMAVSPTFSAYMMQAFSLNVPIFLGGFLQLFHDCVFFYLFQDVKPPEEHSSEPGSAA